MKAVFLSLIALLCLTTQPASAEDPNLRHAAITLLEKANAVSTPAVRPNHEHTVTFRAFPPLQPAGEGEFTRVWAAGNGHRDEIRFGDYHLLNIFLKDKLIVDGSKGQPAPGAVRYAHKFFPIRLVSFDHEDTIQSITDNSVRGREARCIQFDTVFGSSIHANQICVDKQTGTLLRFRDDQEVVENAEFFSFAGALLPGRVDVSRNGVEVLEIHQSVTVLDGPMNPDVFAAPPGAQIRTRCGQYRRAFGQSMPQPPLGRGSQNVDVVLHGTIGGDGKVLAPVIVQSDRPDLNEEALQLITTWTFQPAMCDGKANTAEANFVLHFQGR